MREFIDSVGKALIVLAAVAYAAGLLITNIDLADYGVASFSLNRSQYIVVGSAWLVLTGLASVFCFLVLMAGFRRDNWARGTALFIITTYMLFGTLHMVEVDPLPAGLPFYFRVFSVLPQVLLMQALVYAPVSYVRRCGVTRPLISADVKSRPYSRVGAIIISVLFITAWIPAYAKIVFPNVKPQFGGGNHPRAVVALRLPAEVSAEEMTVLMGPIKVQKLTTEVVTVLEADGDYVVIRADQSSPTRLNPQSPTILVRKEVILAIRYQ